jgi:hypothetical protein
MHTLSRPPTGMDSSTPSHLYCHAQMGNAQALETMLVIKALYQSARAPQFMLEVAPSHCVGYFPMALEPASSYLSR